MNRKLLALFIFLFLGVVIVTAGALRKAYLVDAADNVNQHISSIHIDGKEVSNSRGGVILLSSFSEPVINISGYNLQDGNIHINVYKSSMEELLSFLVHDDKNKQLKPKVETKNSPLMTSLDVFLSGETYSYRNQTSVSLPIKNDGVFLLSMFNGDKSYYAFVVNSSIGTVAHEAEKGIVFWSQDFLSKKSLESGVVSIYDLEGKKKLLESNIINQEGIAHGKLDERADIAITKSGDKEALVFLNLKTLNSEYYSEEETFKKHNASTRYFAFTDRPLYKPGDTVKFKAILRADMDVDYRLFKGRIKVEAYSGYGEEKTVVYSDSLNISDKGSLDGEFVIPKFARTGDYTINLKKEGEAVVNNWWGYTPEANISFSVEHYRKPEYSLEINQSSQRVIAGSKLQFQIKGSYFSGQPLNKKIVKYSIRKNDYYEPSYLEYFDIDDNSYNYGYYYGQDIVREEEVELNEEGIADIVIDEVEKNSTKSKVYIIEASYKDNTQNQVIARKNILIQGSEFGVFLTNQLYSVEAGSDAKMNFKLVPFGDDKDVQGKKLKAVIKRSEWICPNNYWNCTNQIDFLPERIIETDKNGEAMLLIEKIKKGSYTVLVSFEDKNGNKPEKEFHIWVGDYYYDDFFNNQGGGSDLSIVTDKSEYKVGEIIKLKVFSKVDRDAFVSIGRDWIKRYKVLKIRGGEVTAEMPVETQDVPNVLIGANSFSNFWLDQSVKNVTVSAEKYKLNIDIKTDKKEYGPGDTVKLDIFVKDKDGKGVSTESTIWLADKALFELSDSNTGDIFNAFWSSRYSYSSMSHSLQSLNMDMAEKGCFSADTEILMKNGKKKSINKVKVGDRVLTFSDAYKDKLVESEVTNVHSAKVSGYLIINNRLKITSNHIVFINNKWSEAGLIQVGDKLRLSDGRFEIINSIEWQKGNFEVYNLTIKDYHTFIANDFWVHNDKGGGSRSVFEDAAYWNPSVKTGSNGKASVTFKLPDNLTTWVISAVAATTDTKVGQAKSELLVTKDIFIQPVLPNILRTGDDMIVSALVNNYSNTDREFLVGLEFNSGRVASTTQKVFIKSKSFEKINWPISPEKASDSALIKFSAFDVTDEEIGDVIEQKIPVKEFGFWQTRAYSGKGNNDFKIELIASSTKESNISLTMSLSAKGPIMSAMGYLVEYPYGCMEQTTSRFVPVVIAKENEALFREKLQGKDLDAMVSGGIDRLATFQNNDGGWSWWNSDNSELALSAYIFEYVIKAEKAKVKIDKSVTEKAYKFFKNLDPVSYERYKVKSENEVKAYKNYILSLLGEKFEEMNNFDNLDIESLSYAIMANQLGGYKDAAKKGVEELMKKSQGDGDNIFWNAGDAEKYGSRDASSAIALRALLATKYDSLIVNKIAGNLLNNRHTYYWSNTYGTAKVIQALVDYLREYQLKESNKYVVYLDDEIFSQGEIDENNSIIELIIPENKIKNNGSDLKIRQEGKTEIYSTLLIKSFNNNLKAEAISNGLTIERYYQNEKGVNYSIGIGDLVDVTLKISGLSYDGRYVLVEDFLPAGMIPVIQSLNNENGGNYYSRWYWYGDMDYKEDGVQAYLSYPGGGNREIRYKARVVNQGVFQVPPARVEYMYSPEVSAITAPQVVEIGNESKEMWTIKEATCGQAIFDFSSESEKKQCGAICSLVLIIPLILLVVFKIVRFSFNYFLKRKKIDETQ